MSEKTNFGYQHVTPEEKTEKVSGVFSSVATRYDLMNDLMSLGIHRLWKRYAIDLCAVRSGQCVLDLAGGTGDLTKQFAKRVGKQGHVYLTDINAAMIRIGRERLLNVGVANNTSYIQADAEYLPFADQSFDCISIAFGLRNITHKETALRSMYRVLKPGGRLIVLEFSKPTLSSLQTIYDIYSFKLLPRLGEFVTGDAQSYQYLVESIRMHPDQESLKEIIEEQGFDECEYYNLMGGVVAAHRAYKY